MFHTLTKHISRISAKKQQRQKYTNATTKNKEQNIDNQQNLFVRNMRTMNYILR